MSLYVNVDVWQRLSDGRLKRYRCFKSLVTGRYAIQSADYYEYPPDHKRLTELDNQFIELLSEDAPDSRSKSFESLAAAIADFDRIFGID